MFDGDSIASGNVPLILNSQLADGDYNPTETIYGKFQVLECKDCERTIAELKEHYDRKFELTDEEKNLVPKLPENTMYQQKHRRLWTRLSTAPCGFSLVSGKLAQVKQQTQNYSTVVRIAVLCFYMQRGNR